MSCQEDLHDGLPKWPNRCNHTVALHSFALHFPGFRGVSQENRTTPPWALPCPQKLLQLQSPKLGKCKCIFVNTIRDENITYLGKVIFVEQFGISSLRSFLPHT